MVVAGAAEACDDNSGYDRVAELRAFDDTKAGVKGLVDAGVSEVPQMFHHSPDNFEKSSVSGDNRFCIPIIDLEGVKEDVVKHKVIVEQVGEASKTWGFFQVINHGVPMSVLEDIEEGVRSFFEQDLELKKQFFSRDYTKKLVYNSNFDLSSAPAANWKDTLVCFMSPDPPEIEELPAACRYILCPYWSNNSSVLKNLKLNRY